MKIKNLGIILTSICFILSINCVSAKKYKWKYNSHPLEVYSLALGKNGNQLVKSWAVGKNADKAILQAKMDAIEGALFKGIPYDESTHGMGVSNLPPLVSTAQYEENANLFFNFFKTGDFLKYVNAINGRYPTGENNIAVKGGRRIGINLSIDYRGLHQWLEQNGIVKGVGNHFKN